MTILANWARVAVTAGGVVASIGAVDDTLAIEAIDGMEEEIGADVHEWVGADGWLGVGYHNRKRCSVLSILDHHRCCYYRHNRPHIRWRYGGYPI